MKDPEVGLHAGKAIMNVGARLEWAVGQTLSRAMLIFFNSAAKLTFQEVRVGGVLLLTRSSLREGTYPGCLKAFQLASLTSQQVIITIIMEYIEVSLSPFLLSSSHLELFHIE